MLAIFVASSPNVQSIFADAEQAVREEGDNLNLFGRHTETDAPAQIPDFAPLT